MSKTKKRISPVNVILQGTLFSFAVYVLGLMAIAMLGTSGRFPESNFAQVIFLLAFLSSLSGSFLCVRRASGNNAITAALVCTGVFALLLVTVGMAFWDGISWTGQGGGTLLFVLAGGISAIFLRKRRSSRWKKMRKQQIREFHQNYAEAARVQSESVDFKKNIGVYQRQYILNLLLQIYTISCLCGEGDVDASFRRCNSLHNNVYIIF